MLKYVLIFIISLSTLASEYHCRNGFYHAELSLDGESTHVWFYESFYNELLGQNYTGWSEKLSKHINYHFYFATGEVAFKVSKAILKTLHKECRFS
jgi:hypothetical protein